jgi:hypothetical protein
VPALTALPSCFRAVKAAAAVVDKTPAQAVQAGPVVCLPAAAVAVLAARQPARAAMAVQAAAAKCACGATGSRDRSGSALG